MTIKLLGYPQANLARRWNADGSPYEFMPDQAKIKGQLTTGAGAVHYLAAFGATVFHPRLTTPEDWAGRVFGASGGSLQGDITGAGGGKAKKARATGQGIDPVVKRDDDGRAWLLAADKAALAMALGPMGADVGAMPSGQWAELMAVEAELRDIRERRGALVEDIKGEQAIGWQILALAGGVGWGDGKRQVAVNSGGMAARAARSIVHTRGKGVTPSDTSLQDAAAAAASVMSFQWLCYSALVGEEWNDATRRHLSAYGWRAAFSSLTKDQSEGKTGEKAGTFSKAKNSFRGGANVNIDLAQNEVAALSLERWQSGRFEVLSAGELAEQAALLTDWTGKPAVAIGAGEVAGMVAGRFQYPARVHALDAGARRGAWLGGVRPAVSKGKAAVAARLVDSGQAVADGVQSAREMRRDVLRWMAEVLDTRAKGRTGAAERSRFSLLARLVHGRDWATACKGAGFASGRSGVKSMMEGKVWARLAGAVGNRLAVQDRRLMAIRADAVARAMVAIKAQRAASMGAGRAVAVGAVRPAVARVVRLVSGAVAASYSPTFKGDVQAAMAGAVKFALPASRRNVTTSGIKRGGGLHPMAAAWSQATDERNQAVTLAKVARKELQRARAGRVASFMAATRGLRAGCMAGNEAREVRQAAKSK